MTKRGKMSNLKHAIKEVMDEREEEKMAEDQRRHVAYVEAIMEDNRSQPVQRVGNPRLFVLFVWFSFILSVVAVILAFWR